MKAYSFFSRRALWGLALSSGLCAAFVACSGDTVTSGGSSNSAGSSSSSGGMGGNAGVGGSSQTGGGMVGMGGAPGTGGMMQGMGGMMMPPGPKPCMSDPDCVGACPPGSTGCACESTPMGMVCLPTCQMDSDCPKGPMGFDLVCKNGVCSPDFGGGTGGMGPVDCQTNADCFGACTPGSLGCECASLPQGMVCTSTCMVDAHCPPGPNGTMLTCQGGYCLP